MELIGALCCFLLLAPSASHAENADPASSSSASSRPRRCCRYAEPDDDLVGLCPSDEACVLTTPMTSDPASNGSDAASSPTWHSPDLARCRVQLDSKRDRVAGADSMALVTRGQCLLSRRYDTGQPLALSSSSSPPPLRVLPYAFHEASVTARPLSALDVRIAYDRALSEASFRLQSTAGCPSPSADGEALDDVERNYPGCSPRCVDIQMGGAEDEAADELSYDCEVGFYKDAGRADYQLVVTAGQTYRLDVCLTRANLAESCGSYLFVLPAAEDVDALSDGLALISRDQLEENGRVVLHFPPARADDGPLQREVLVYRRDDVDGEDDEKEEAAYELVGSYASVLSDLALPDRLEQPGYYRLAQKLPETDSANASVVVLAEFSIPEPGGGGAVWLLLLLLFLLLAGLLVGYYTYRRYEAVRTSNQVNPNRLLESGRVRPKSVFLITNVDNRHHIDVVLAFSKYLKSHCGVGQVYFALDPQTGITSQKDHDPWKWAQDVADKMAGSLAASSASAEASAGANDDAGGGGLAGAAEDGSAGGEGCLVFMGSPPPALGVPIYKDLPNNQAFVSTKYLKTMVDENRVAILNFPYSDPSTVPTLVPPHVRASPYLLPRDMNDFLCQLLDVKKRELCACLPMPLVKPQVAPHVFTRFAGGQELLDLVHNLSAKVDLYHAEQKALAAASAAAAAGSGAGGVMGAHGPGSTLSRGDENSCGAFSDSEERGLLRPKKKQAASSVSASAKQDPSSPAATAAASRLKIEIEPNVLSLKGPQVRDRDRSVNPEFDA